MDEQKKDGSKQAQYSPDPLADYGGTDLEGCGIPEEQMTMGIPPIVKPYDPDDQPPPLSKA